MAAKKKSISFPSSAGKFDIAFRALMIHLGIADADSSSSPTAISWIRLGINSGQYNVLVAIFGTATTPNTWLYVRPLQENKATRNSTLRSQELSLIRRALLIIRPLRLSLKAAEKLNPGTLTPTDGKCFFIPVPNPHTSNTETFRTTAPVPVLSLHSVRHLEHSINVHDSANPDINGLPDGVAFIWLKRYIGTTAPTDDSQFSHLVFAPRFRSLSTFLATNAKQDVWYTAAYISNSGLVGLFSPYLHATIAQTA